MNTRQEITNYLEKHPYACAEELSQLLLKTRANIQYHLKRLEQADVIVQVQVHGPVQDRGRPRSYYALSSFQKPDNLASLADALLQVLLKDTEGLAGSTLKLEELARLILSVPSGLPSLTGRLNRLVKELSARNYQARWEAHASGPQVVFRNCPYSPIVQLHPELCKVDASILAANLNTSIETKALIREEMVTACRFLITHEAKKS
jgi:predicted ArsR family transcriptional regulator